MLLKRLNFVTVFKEKPFRWFFNTFAIRVLFYGDEITD